jgi:hypothetical protein
MNYLLIIVVYVFLESTYGFMPKFKLKSLIQGRALYTNIMEKFSFENLNDTILAQFQEGLDFENGEPLYLALFLYLANLTQPDNTKLENVQLYRKNIKMTRQAVFVFLLLFMKNVEAAT